jgi:hypothetical protein
MITRVASCAGRRRIPEARSSRTPGVGAVAGVAGRGLEHTARAAHQHGRGWPAKGSRETNALHCASDWALRPVNNILCDGRAPGRHEWVTTSTVCVIVVDECAMVPGVYVVANDKVEPGPFALLGVGFRGECSWDGSSHRRAVAALPVPRGLVTPSRPACIFFPRCVS